MRKNIGAREFPLRKRPIASTPTRRAAGASHEEGDAMKRGQKPKQTPPADSMNPGRDEEEVVNDSLGTVDSADSTGTDEDKETGDAKANNFDTHED
jgi:hypothetical protein